MDVYLSEEEQLQKIKDWWKKYGSAILIGIIIFLAATFGWRYWHRYKANQEQQASVLYEQMFTANMKHQTDNFQLFANHLIKDYSSTPYASLAALMLAHSAVQNHKLKIAQQNLHWVVENSDSGSLRQIARIREARVLLAAKKPQQALQLLNKIDASSYDSLIAETRGDIYVAMRNKSKALQAYQVAVKTMPKNGMATILQMKINQLEGN